jgi:hypothetical protein
MSAHQRAPRADSYSNVTPEIMLYEEVMLELAQTLHVINTARQRHGHGMTQRVFAPIRPRFTAMNRFSHETRRIERIADPMEWPECHRTRHSYRRYLDCEHFHAQSVSESRRSPRTTVRRARIKIHEVYVYTRKRYPLATRRTSSSVQGSRGGRVVRADSSSVAIAGLRLWPRARKNGLCVSAMTNDPAS